MLCKNACEFDFHIKWIVWNSIHTDKSTKMNQMNSYSLDHWLSCKYAHVGLNQINRNTNVLAAVTINARIYVLFEMHLFQKLNIHTRFEFFCYQKMLANVQRWIYTTYLACSIPTKSFVINYLQQKKLTFLFRIVNLAWLRIKYSSLYANNHCLNIYL